MSELLLAFVNDAPTYVCIDANGRLGSPTSEHVGSLSVEPETPNGEVSSFPCGSGLLCCEHCSVKGMVLLGCRQEGDRGALISWLCLSRRC